MKITEAELERANARMEKLRATTPYALSAKYDAGRIVVTLSSGSDLTFPAHRIRCLENASSAELAEIKISPAGLGLHFPRIDADLYLPALIEEFIGPRNWMARRLGEQGGKSRSPTKQAAARNNGRMGERQEGGFLISTMLHRCARQKPFTCNVHRI